MLKIRMLKILSISLLLIFIINISLFPKSLYVSESNFQNRDGTQDAVQNQNSRFDYDINDATPNQRGFSKAMANGIPTLTEWWDTDYDYRRMINVTEPGTIARSQEPVTFNVNFTQGFARNNSLRIAFYNSSGWFPVVSQVWENSTFYGGAYSEYYDDVTITFFVDSIISQEQTYYLYYDDDDRGLPSYTDNINATAANGPAQDDPTPDYGNPWVYNDVTGTNITGVDTVYIASSVNNTHAAILLTDYLRDGSDWGGASCALITANYGNSDALDTNNGTSNREYFVIGDLALDHDALGDPMSDLSSNRANVAPNNPIEAWVPGAGVWITDDGPLFTKIKIVTSDGGYQDNTNFMYSPEDDETGEFFGSRNDRGGSGFVNYTFVYTFYYHGNNLFVNLKMDIEINTHHGYDPIATKNYDDWPHVMALGGSEVNPIGPVDVKQNRKAWTSSLNFTTPLLNGSTDPRWWDLPLEPWTCWYDDENEPNYDTRGDPTIGIVAKTDPLGWEVFSLAVPGVGDNLVLQRKITYGWFGDFFKLYNGTVLSYDYYVFTSAYGTNYTEIRDFSSKINNPMEISVGVEELYEHNILTVQTMASPHSWPTDSISNVNVTIQKTGYSDWGLTDANGEYQFTKVPDGTVIGGDPYTIISTYTIGANPTYTVDIITNYDINHSIDRAPTLQINCDLSRLQITATNADGGSALVGAIVRMRRAPPNQAEYIEGTTDTGGIINFILYYSDPPGTEGYTIEVEHPQGTPAVSVTPTTVTVPTVSSQSVSCVVAVHATTLNFVTPAQAFVSTVIGDSVTFTMEYWDLVDSQSISGATTADWTLKLDTTTVDSGTLSELLPGNPGQYQKILNTSSLTAGQTYTLTFELNKDTPVDYAPATFVFSVAVNYISTQLSIPIPGQTYQVDVNQWVYLTIHFERSGGGDIDQATVDIEGTIPTELNIVGIPGQTDVNGDCFVDIQATDIGAFSVTFKANKTGYADGFTYFTLATGAQPAHLVITNPGSPTQATIGIGQSFTLNMRYETTPAGTDLPGADWNITVDPDIGWTPPNPTDEGGGDYSVVLAPPAAGTYTIVFTANYSGYTDGVTFFTLLMSDIPASLTVSPGSAGILAGGWVSFTLWYKNGTTGIPGATIARSISPSGPSLNVEDKGGGKYTVSGSFGDPNTYTIRFTASKTNYTDGRVTAVLNVAIRPTKLEITSPTAAEIIAEEMYSLKVKYTDTTTGSGVGGGSVSVVVTPTMGMTYEPGEHLGSGIYQIVLHGDSVGTYTVTVTLSRNTYRRASANFFLTVKPIPTILNILELQGTNLTTSLAQPINETFQVMLNFARDENASRPVENATISLLGIEEWQMADYLGNGTYKVEVSTGETLGIYPILIMASKSNYEVGRAAFELYVRPFTTELLLWGREEASATVPVSETLELEVYYNNTDWGEPISGAELAISGLPLTNERTITWAQTEWDTYRVSIGTGSLPETKLFTLTITGRHPPQFDSASTTFELTIITIPFRAQNQPPVGPGEEPTLAQSLSVVEDQKANVTIQLWDTYHDTPIEGAEVTWTLYVPETEEQGTAKAAAATPTLNSATIQSPEGERASGGFEYIGNGTYVAFVSAKGLDPGTYRLEVTATKELYGEQTFTMDYVVTPKPGTPTTYFLGLASIIVGSIGGFYSWYFYFRWPPQVRYIRKALKRVEAGSQVEEGRFPSKEEHRQAITEEQLRLPRQLME